MSVDYQAAMKREAWLVDVVKGKDEEIADLKTRAQDSKARVTDLSAEVDRLQHQLEESKESVQQTAQYCLLLGKINAMKESDEAKAAWDVKAEEEKLAAMVEEQGEVSSKPSDQPRSPVPDQALHIDECSPAPGPSSAPGIE